MASLIATIFVVALVLAGYELGEIIFGSIRRRIEERDRYEARILRDQYGNYNIDEIFKPKR